MLCAILRRINYVMLCYVMLCYVMLCYVMLCYVMLCYVMLIWPNTDHVRIYNCVMFGTIFKIKKCFEYRTFFRVVYSFLQIKE